MISPVFSSENIINFSLYTKNPTGAELKNFLLLSMLPSLSSVEISPTMAGIIFCQRIDINEVMS